MSGCRQAGKPDLLALLRFGGALRPGAGGKRRGLDARAGKIARQFLPPMGNVARGAVNVDHLKGFVPEVGQLMKEAGRDVHRLVLQG